jgi:hypothetical protein
LAAAGTSLFFALVPGIVAGVIPWWLTGWQAGDPLPYGAPLRVAGAVVLLAGAVVLLHAFARFVIEGIGTPAPAAPTERLVVGGLYRYVRNPMYLAVAAVIAGQGLLLSQPRLLLYGTANTPPTVRHSVRRLPSGRSRLVATPTPMARRETPVKGR